jgi:hypothetical protein
MRSIKKIENFKKVPAYSGYLDNLIKKGYKYTSNIWKSTKVKSKETKIAINIIYKIVKKEDISNKEKKFLKAHLKDMVKILPLVAIQVIPIPIPVTPLLIIMNEKYRLNILPKDNRYILKDEDNKN